MSGMRRSMLMSSKMCKINVIAANTSLHDAEVIEGDAYSTQIVVDAGYSIYEITIKMGGVDITSTAYDPTYNMISIPSVTDDVDIECYAMHTLPSDYIRVDGIKNPSNAYLDTGYKCSSNNRLELSFVLVWPQPTVYDYIGTNGNAANIQTSGWRIFMNTNPNYSGYVYAHIGGGDGTETINTGLRANSSTLNKTHLLISDFYKKEYYADGNKVTTTKSKSSTDTYDFCLYSSRSGYYADRSAGQIVHHFKIYDYSTNAYVRYYIPCLNDSGVAGFWDAARGVFQGSSNSTAFEAVTSPDTYVGGGKIFHLDGIEKGDTADAWTNLVGNQVLTKQGDVEAIENGWRFPGTIDDYLVSSTQPYLIGENITVEVCFKPESASGMVFAPNQRLANKAVFYKDGDRYLFQQDNYTYTCATTLGNKYTMSFSQGRGLVNMTSIAKDATTSFITFAVNNYMFVGVRRTSNAYYVPFKGEIYAIRVYNRQLTEAEVLHNQKIDNIRFNLGLTT